MLPRAAKEEGAELAGVLLKKSLGADEPSDGPGAANSSPPNRSLDADYSPKNDNKNMK